MSAAVTVVVGVDGAGRTRRLDQLAAGSAGPVLRVNPPSATLETLHSALAATPPALVLVDDPHRLGPQELVLLTAVARSGVAMVLARRPTIDGRELADLDEVVAARGAVELLAPLDLEATAALIASVTGRPAAAEQCAAVHAASAGLPAIAAAIAGGQPGEVAPALLARVQRRLARLAPRMAALARLLALRLDLPDGVLAAASSVDGSGSDVDIAAAMRVLRDEGLLEPGGERMVPAVADAVLHELPAAERRRVHEAVAHALVARGSDTMVAADQLRAARAYVPAAAGSYLAAGERLRFDDPAAALGWFDDALESGADPGLVAAGRAEAAALLGLPFDPGPAVRDDRLTLVDGAVQAHEGRLDRCAETLAAANPPGPVLAVPAQVAIGALAAARDASRTPAAGSSGAALRRFAEAAVAAAADPAGAVPLLIEAADVLERTPPAVVLPDTPHALGALAAAVSGDAGTAEHLLNRAIAGGVGGPVAAERHRLLLAWVRLRSGRYDTAVAELARLAGAEAGLRGRERFLVAALTAAVARRSGDVATLRDAWSTVEPALARRTVDLFTAEAVEELAVAATRLRRQSKVAAVLEALDTIVERLGTPPAWAVCVGWIRVQIALAEEDGPAAARAAAGLPADRAASGRPRALCQAAQVWAELLAGRVEAETVLQTADDLAAVELPWEASRLVGQAAIRVADAALARRLLERARELSSAEVLPADARAETQHGGLSERELEVARMVLAGDTYREIGGRLFISPKTVEHHVARIRTKLGATSRAEFVAALRTVLERP